MSGARLSEQQLGGIEIEALIIPGQDTEQFVVLGDRLRDVSVQSLDSDSGELVGERFRDGSVVTLDFDVSSIDADRLQIAAVY